MVLFVFIGVTGYKKNQKKKSLNPHLTCISYHFMVRNHQLLLSAKEVCNRYIRMCGKDDVVANCKKCLIAMRPSR